jgi:hypothetical protein
VNVKEQKRVKTLVKTVREMIEPDNPYTPDDLLWIMAVVEELAEKLGVEV